MAGHTASISIGGLRLPTLPTAMTLSVVLHGGLFAVLTAMPGGVRPQVTQQPAVQFAIGRPVPSAAIQATAPSPVDNAPPAEVTPAPDRSLADHQQTAMRAARQSLPTPTPTNRAGAEQSSATPTDDPPAMRFDAAIVAMRAFAEAMRATSRPSPSAQSSMPVAQPPSGDLPRDAMRTAEASNATRAASAMSASSPSTPQPRGIDRGASILELASPVYPRRAIRLGLEGTAVVHVAIDGAGSVTAVRLHHSAGHALLDEAAIRAARSGRYRGALVDGTPAPAVLRIPFEFRLQ